MTMRGVEETGVGRAPLAGAARPGSCATGAPTPTKVVTNAMAKEEGDRRVRGGGRVATGVWGVIHSVGAPIILAFTAYHFEANPGGNVKYATCFLETGMGRVVLCRYLFAWSAIHWAWSIAWTSAFVTVMQLRGPRWRRARFEAEMWLGCLILSAAGLAGFLTKLKLEQVDVGVVRTIKVVEGALVASSTSSAMLAAAASMLARERRQKGRAAADPEGSGGASLKVESTELDE